MPEPLILLGVQLAAFALLALGPVVGHLSRRRSRVLSHGTPGGKQ